MSQILFTDQLIAEHLDIITAKTLQMIQRCATDRIVVPTNVQRHAINVVKLKDFAIRTHKPTWQPIIVFSWRNGA